MSATETMAVDMAAVRADHMLAQAKAETASFGGARLSHGVSFKQGHRAGWWEGVEYVLTLQAQMDSLTVGEMLTELRKGPGSIYWPLKEADPTFWADCPRCEVPQLIDVQGLCPACAHEFCGDQ